MPLQDTDPTPSFGGFGLRLAGSIYANKHICRTGAWLVDSLEHNRRDPRRRNNAPGTIPVARPRPLGRCGGRGREDDQGRPLPGRPSRILPGTTRGGAAARAPGADEQGHRHSRQLRREGRPGRPWHIHEAAGHQHRSPRPHPLPPDLPVGDPRGRGRDRHGQGRPARQRRGRAGLRSGLHLRQRRQRPPR